MVDIPPWHAASAVTGRFKPSDAYYMLQGVWMSFTASLTLETRASLDFLRYQMLT
jgi:hypothetical protein